MNPKAIDSDVQLKQNLQALYSYKLNRLDADQNSSLRVKRVSSPRDREEVKKRVTEAVRRSLGQMLKFLTDRTTPIWYGEVVVRAWGKKEVEIVEFKEIAEKMRDSDFFARNAIEDIRKLAQEVINAAGELRVADVLADEARQLPEQFQPFLEDRIRKDSLTRTVSREEPRSPRELSVEVEMALAASKTELKRGKLPTSDGEWLRLTDKPQAQHVYYRN